MSADWGASACLGLCCALHNCQHSSASSTALRCVRLLLSEHRRPDLAAGDYANFAATAGLAQLTSNLSMDEVLIREVAAVLCQGLETAG